MWHFQRHSLILCAAIFCLALVLDSQSGPLDFLELTDLEKRALEKEETLRSFLDYLPILRQEREVTTQEWAQQYGSDTNALAALQELISQARVEVSLDDYCRRLDGLLAVVEKRVVSESLKSEAFASALCVTFASNGLVRLPRSYGPSGWRSVAQSDCIVAGVLEVQVPEPVQELKDEKSVDSLLRLQVSEVLESRYGSPPKTLEFEYATSNAFKEAGDIEPHNLLPFNGSNVVVCLVLRQSRSSTNSRPAYILYSRDTIAPYGSELVEDVVHTMSELRHILGTYDQLSREIRETDPFFGITAELIEELSDPLLQGQAMRGLGRLGPASVPSMIVLMDDRRPLPHKTVTVRSKSKIETIDHLPLHSVIDALTFILHGITGESFSYTGKGASERQLDKAVDCWRIYLYYLMEEMERREKTVDQ